MKAVVSVAMAVAESGVSAWRVAGKADGAMRAVWWSSVRVLMIEWYEWREMDGCAA